MPKLVIQNGQLGVSGRDIFDFDAGVNATDMVMKHLPDGINPDCSVVYINLKKIEFNEEPGERLFQPLSNNDVVLIVNEVKGLSAAAVAVIIAVIAVAAVIILAPKLPGNVGQRKESPNNNLQGQTNLARPYQAYPLIFGSPRVYPDLTGEAITEYINNQKFVTQLMNVGIGLFDITGIKAGDTPLENFSGASSTIYEPVDRVVTVPDVVTSFSINEIDGQVLLGVNDGIDGTSYSLVENGVNQTTYVGSTFTFEVQKDANSDALKASLSASVVEFVVEVLYRANISGFGGITTVRGTGSMNSMTLDGGMTFYTIIIVGFSGPGAVDGIYEGPFTVTEKVGTSLGPIGVAIEMEEIWVNILFNRGLKGTVDLFLLMQQLDGPNGEPVVGPQQGFTFSFTEDTLEAKFFTFKGVLFVKGFYRFTISRTNKSNQDSENPDQTTIEAVYAINRFTNLTFDNNTLVEIVMPGTVNATSLRENKINLELTSKLITYDGTDIITTVSPSRKMADALLHMYVDFFGLDSITLALDELYEIQNRLDAIDPRLATFDFTFDDIDVSLDERMDSILQVARCFKWLDGDIYRFGRDDVREFASTTITRRDIVDEGTRDYSLSYNPQLLEAFDSVKVEFVDPDVNKNAYIFRTFDINSVDQNNPTIIDGTGKNPKTMQLAGCREEFNAINRAELEIRKLIYQRFVLTDTMHSSGMFLDRGDMVLYAEQYSSDLFDGEILSIDGDVATTSESIDFSVGELFIHYMIEDGSKVGPFEITEIEGQVFKFQSSNLSQVFLRDSIIGFTVQIGTRYIIGTTENLDAARWSIVDKEAQGNNVQLTMLNYDDRIYDFD